MTTKRTRAGSCTRSPKRCPTRRRWSSRRGSALDASRGTAVPRQHLPESIVDGVSVRREVTCLKQLHRPNARTHPHILVACTSRSSAGTSPRSVWTPSSTRRTTLCAAAAASTGRSTGRVDRRSWRIASSGFRMGWPRARRLDDCRTAPGPVGHPRGGAELRRGQTDRSLLTSCYSERARRCRRAGRGQRCLPLGLGGHLRVAPGGCRRRRGRDAAGYPHRRQRGAAGCLRRLRLRRAGRGTAPPILITRTIRL